MNPRHKILKLPINIILATLIVFTTTCSDYQVTRESGLISLSLLRRVVHIPSNSTATIIGQVRDRESDEPIYMAEVVTTDLKFSCITDSNGNYIIRNIPKGTYQVSTEWITYHKAIYDSLTIEGNEIVILDFRLAQKSVRLE